MIAFLKRLAASVPTPGTGKVTLFVDSADGSPKVKNDAGTVTTLGGAATPTGTGFRRVTAGVEDGAAAYPTKADVGLGNVDNTADLAKPVSTAQQTAIDTAKARANHTGTQAASTITGLATVATSGLKSDVGLGNVDNVAVLGRHMVPIMAGAIQPSVAGGASAVTSTATAANQPDIVTIDFDTTTQEFAQFAVPMPESWDEGPVQFAPVWTHAAAATNFGVVWGLQGVAVSDGDAIGAAFGVAQTSSDTGGVTNAEYVGPISAPITIAGTPVAGDTVFFRVHRDPVNAADTLAVDARLIGIRLYINNAAMVD